MSVYNGFPRDEAARSAESTSSPVVSFPLPSLEGYTLIRLLGEGGCGVVYLAEQQAPLRRSVALKLIKPGMDSRAVIRRFEAERQTLALMEHTNITRVLDAGMTAAGQLYFAMELVDGGRITDHCDAGRLSVEKRLTLFTQICFAIQHAHQKGIIHRDIKPANILVARPVGPHGTATPKVVDFGIAKAIQGLPGDNSCATAFGFFTGTPAYMSPEQVERPTEADARSDLYSLGVVLYELLTGATPFQPDELQVSAAKEPIRPSLRIAAVEGAARLRLAGQRQSEPGKLARQLRGDLDWIVLRALEKDPARRYATAADLAHDIERHLRGDAVSARPPTLRYRLRCYARRHRAAFTALLSIGVALAGGLTLATTGWVRALSAQRTAEHALAEAEAVTEFFTGAVAAADPARLGRDVTVRQLLEHAAPTAEMQFKDRPLLRARLYANMGETYFSLGQYGPAKELLARATEIHRRSLSDNDAVALRTKTSLAEVFTMTNEPVAAIALARSIVAIQDKTGAATARERIKPRRILSMGLFMAGGFEEAVKNGRTVVELCVAAFGSDHLETLNARMNLAFQLWAVEEYAAGIEQGELVIAAGSLPPLHPIREMARHAAAISAEELGDYEKARHQESLAASGLSTLFGADYFHTLSAQMVHDYCESFYGEPAAAVKRVEAIFATQGRLLPQGHPNLQLTAARLAWLLHRNGRTSEALALATKACAGLRAAFGTAPPTFRAEAECARYEVDLGEPVKAEQRSRRILAELGALPRRYEYSISRASIALAAALTGQRRFVEGEKVLLENHATLAALTLDVKHQQQLTQEALAGLYVDWRKPAEAAK